MRYGKIIIFVFAISMLTFTACASENSLSLASVETSESVSEITEITTEKVTTTIAETTTEEKTTTAESSTTAVEETTTTEAITTTVSETTTSAETTVMVPETTTVLPETTTAVTTTSVTTTAPLPERTTPTDLLSAANEIAEITNSYRVQNGLQPLKVNVYMCNAAQLRANELISKYDHVRPDGRAYNTCLSDVGIKTYLRDFGENIAYWTDGGTGDKISPEYIVGTVWMNSPGHRANILRDNWEYIGVGIAKGSNGYYYFVQEFSDAKNGVTLAG